MNIWKTLSKPFFALAPMEGFTDHTFRQMLVKYGKPDIMFTEFTNIDQLLSVGNKYVIPNFSFKEKDRPIIAQIWGHDPIKFEKAAKVISAHKFDGIDINMGCSVRKVLAQKSCAALIKNKVLASEIIAATKNGAGELPVSVKTRLGYEKSDVEDWCQFLLEQKLDALTIHGRTAKQLYHGNADWNEIAKISKLRSKINPNTILIGNGDIKSIRQATRYAKEYKVDGIMIGRAVMGNFLLFNKKFPIQPLTKSQKIELLVEHISLFFKDKSNKDKNPMSLKKYYKTYLKEFLNAAELRQKIMMENDFNKVISYLRSQIDK
ncbi:tRNA-dihydrouridine synthase [Candidatus Dojkabacteria bacterium]|nr:tRNA-dihydrouridine synthase [Candidatus Dojkabacteria bacterium]